MHEKVRRTKIFETRVYLYEILSESQLMFRVKKFSNRYVFRNQVRCVKKCIRMYCFDNVILM